MAAVLLYCWLALFACYIIPTQWRAAGFGLLSIWIFDIAILAALLWVIIETANGRNWARITLLIVFALSVRGLTIALVQQSRSRPILALAIFEFVMFSAAIILLFSGTSLLYFKTPRA